MNRQDVFGALGRCLSALDEANSQFQGEAAVSGVIGQTRSMLSDCTSVGLRKLVETYLELYKLRVGETADGQAAAAKVKEASKHLRDAVVSACLGLVPNATREEFLAVLDEASDGRIGAKGFDGENLKSSLLKACYHVVGRVPSPSPQKPRRKRAAKGKKQRGEAHEEGSFHEHFQTAWPWYMQQAWPSWAWAPPSQMWVGMPNCGDAAGEPAEAEPEPTQLHHDMDCKSDAGTVSFSGTDLSALYQHQVPAKYPVDQVSIPDTYDSYDWAPPVVHRTKAATLASIDDVGAAEESDAEEGEDHYATAFHIATCTQCETQDFDGWNDSRQRYYCVRCWKAWNKERQPSEEGTAAEGRESVPAAAKRYDMLDPVKRATDADIGPCEVIVFDGDAFDAARLMKGDATCLVALGGETLLPKPSQCRRHCKNFFERTDFKDIFKDCDETVPRWGGFYAPKVSVLRDDFLDPLQNPFEISAIYAAAAWGPNITNSVNGSTEKSAAAVSEWAKDWQRFRGEMREKIRNLIRICHRHGHTTIIVSMASACFAGAPAADFAALWHECLFDVGLGDTPGLAKRVVFAIPSKWTSLKVNLSFRQEFQRPREVLEKAANCKADRKLLILAGSKLCVDARLHIDKCTVGNIEVGLWTILIGAAQEHQIWLHLPCGRLVLAAFPSLCLSAVPSSSSGVHLSTRHETNNTDLQIWQANADGTISLLGRPHLRLTAKPDNALGLECLNTDEAVELGQVWQMMPVELGVARLAC
jgi:hypothetical protein